MTARQSTAKKLKDPGFKLCEIEVLLGMPATRKGAGARHELKMADGKRRVGGKYE